MQRFKIAPGGPEVSAIAYGVWRLAEDSQGSATARVRRKIDACLEVGITTFDHADIYGDYTCEGLFGAALAEVPSLREQMEIVTKCGIKAPCDALPDTEVKHYAATADWIAHSVDRSLSELNTDYIDLLLIHRPDWLTSAEDKAAGLKAVMASGKVRSVGVSNYSTHQFALLDKYLDGQLATNQVELSLMHMDAITDGTLDQCQASGAHPMAWSPLAGGALFEHTALNNALEEMSGDYGVTAEQLALAWVAQLPSNPQVIIGTNQVERIRAAAESTAITLTRQDWYKLWVAAQGRDIP